MLISEVKKDFHSYVTTLQKTIIAELSSLDPTLKITHDQWTRNDHLGNDGGGGLTVVLEGDLIENAGVNTSLVYGEIDPQFASTLRGSGQSLWATGLSLIIHPRNPHIPTVHANFRFIHQGDAYWFGGGSDLTPYYPHKEDFRYFHTTWKKACQDPLIYQQFKKNCDQYFVNHHRIYQNEPEMRGVGGIFFDHFGGQDLKKDLSFVKRLGDHFLESYLPLVEKRKNEPYGPETEKFQLFRRGRYVEFNLLHDRGTLFGLKTKGRTESILVSLPQRCTYHYQPPFTPGSPEEEMMGLYRPLDWT